MSYLMIQALLGYQVVQYLPVFLLVHDIEFHYFHPESVCIKQYHFPRFFELRYCYQCDLLPDRPFDHCGLKFRLVSHKVDMRTFVDDERIVFLERITPWGMSVSVFCK